MHVEVRSSHASPDLQAGKRVAEHQIECVGLDIGSCQVLREVEGTLSKE